ncbi:MAG: nodulation protein NfeD [Elusimicrobiota bacterium]|nr:nodulation protein NfeD [Elusimicrobiota bacterium]
MALNFSDICAEVYIFEIDGIINPVVAEYISDGIKSIPEGKTVIIRLNTPGGLMDSMQKIIQAILNTPNPVIIWVGPEGAKAASAGVFITMASDVATMAPATNIGAAHPVQLTPVPLPSREEPEEKPQKGKKSRRKETKDTMGEKITKDAAAYMRAIAGEKKRNWKWAEKAVTESLSITSKEAKELKVIEYIFSSIDELRQELDGKVITKFAKRKFVIRTKNVEVIKKDMKPFKKFLNLIAHPNVAFILLILGIYGLIYEFASPGIGLGAIVGSTCLILAFFALQLLPVNIAGLLLLLFGILLMLVDFFTPGFGLLFTGGVIAFIFGSLMLFDFPGKFIAVSLNVVIPVVIFTVLFFLVAVRAVIKVHHKKVTTGKEGLLGLKGIAKSNFTKDTTKGMIFVHGEYWSAEIIDEKEVKTGEEVEVVSIDGSVLKIRKI